jgi:hypothetical protein
MSMPQYIEIAVVASKSDTIRAITKGAKISEPGIAPRYFLASLDKPSGKRVINLSELESDRILFWIVLDDKAKSECEKLHLKNTKNIKYSRGFYDIHLPDPVIQVSSNSEFNKLIKVVYEAFCATS